MRSDRLILLASGWGKVDLGWRYLSSKFKKAGYDVITASYPLRGQRPIEVSAEQVVRALEVLDDKYEHVAFIGHSMGGLIGRHLVQSLGYDGLKAYISLGTPHHGSPMALLAPWSPSAMQMRLNSGFIKELNTMPWPESLPTLSVSGSWDTLVWPKNRAVFRGNHIHLPKTTHTGLLLNPRTFHEIWGFLTYEIFSEMGYDRNPGYTSRMELGYE